MHMDRRIRELRLDRERLGNRSAGSGRTVSEQLVERCLIGAMVQSTAIAGQVFANRARQNTAARGAPVKI